MTKNFLPFALMGLLLISCGPQKQNSHTTDEFSGSKFYYLNADDRAKVLADLRDMVLDNYVLLSIKSRLGIVSEPAKLFDTAIAREPSFDTGALTDPLDQARSNLQFIGRVRSLIATFQDTHFSARPVVAMPMIYNGLSLARVGTDVRVVSKQAQVIAYDASHAAQPDDYAKITLGAKVVSIDGIPVNDAAAALRPIISASTPEFADIGSCQGLAQRSINYPETPYGDWEFAVDGNPKTFTVRLPYFYGGNSTRPDALYFLKAKGFQNISDLKLTWDEKAGS